MTKDKELVVKQEGQIAVGEQIPGMEMMEREDLVLPMIYPDGKKGVYWNALDDGKSQEIECVLLSFTKGFKLREGDPPKTACRSFDRVKGTVHGLCASCPNSPGIGGKCQPTYEFLLVKDGQAIPYVLSIAQRTSFGAAQKYLTQFKAARMPLFTVKTLLGFESRTNKGGQSYEVMTFKKVEDLDQETAAKYQAIMNEYRFRGVMEDADDKPGDEVDLSSDLPF